jgi:homocysteine S-methyltransferase
MTSINLQEKLKLGTLLADGALGSELYARGIIHGSCLDALNLTDPAAVLGVHAGYLQAGADLIETNTFGANPFRLASHGHAEQVAAINQAGVALARQAVAASGSAVAVAGSVGPLGVRLTPFGRVKPEAAFAAFSVQISTLLAAGVDALVLETFSDLMELSEAVRAARNCAAAHPPVLLVASMTFTRDDRTQLGDSPAHVARTLAGLGVDVLGANCSIGPAQLLRVLKAMHAAAPQLPLSIMPNAGMPELSGGRVLYPAGPAYFAQLTPDWLATGARIVGGCCGTTPAHIAALRQALDTPRTVAVRSVPARPSSAAELLPATDEPTKLSTQLQSKRFVITVEMSPPKGYTPHKVLAGAHMLAEAGADVINVADSPLARMRMSPWAVCHLIQQQVGVETVLHFPTRGRNLLRVQGDLLAAHALGVRNVFVVMGDPANIGDFPQASDTFDVAPTALLQLVKQRFNAGMDQAGQDIGQPTSFVAACALSLSAPDPAREIKLLRKKLECGADFALTQPVFDAQVARDFFARYAAEHGPLQLPVLVGVLPLYSERHAGFLHNEVPGVHIPEATQRRIAGAADVPAEGVRIALELLAELREIAPIRGAYLQPPFRRYELAAEIIEHTRAQD